MTLHSNPKATPRSVLQSVFGHAAFRGMQEAVVSRLMSGGDAVVLMPTGAGKSLCYQIPAICRPGVGVVVSPLIALMQDQVRSLTDRGVRAAALHSSQSAEESATVRRALFSGELDLLYLAPERLILSGFLDALSRMRVALFAIDEAHCVSQWGHDFRPEYRQLAVLAERFPGVPRIALTATADELTRRDIVDRLALDDAQVFAAGFDRPNIRYRVVGKSRSRRGQDLLLEFLAGHRGESGIVYRMTRTKVDQTAAFLARRGIPALPYHAGMPPEERAANMARFMAEDGLVMVATIAFGMGVNKPDVRFVAHLDPPKSIEAYHQETGRAGRDGLPAEAWMAWSLTDVASLKRVTGLDGAAEALPEHKRVELDKLAALLGYCESAECRRKTLLEYFGEGMEDGCGNCDRCLNPPPVADMTVAAQKLLSCVYRAREASGCSFGARHLIDILRGERTPAVDKFGHHGLSTFGLGADLDVESWETLFRQLAARGAVGFEPEANSAITLAPAAWPILKGRETLRLPMETGEAPVTVRRSRTKADGSASASSPSSLPGWTLEFLADPSDAALFQDLRALRKTIAAEKEVPAYVVFHDRTLLELTLRRPRTAEDFAASPGVGQVKAEKYAEAFLAVIAKASERAASSLPPTPPATADLDRAVSAGQAKRAETSATIRTTIDTFRELRDPAAVAQARGLGRASIWNHLASAVALGELTVPEATGLDEPELAAIRDEIRRVRTTGEPGLKPVFEAFDGRYGYGILRCVEAAAQAGRT